MKTVSLTQAKAEFERLVDHVSRRGERVIITRRGRPVADLLSFREYLRLTVFPIPRRRMRRAKTGRY